MKNLNWKKIGKRIAITLIVLILAVIVIFYAMFHNEIATLNSIEKVDDHTLYTMEYQGDYGFDEFLETGASNDGELIQFVSTKLLKGLPLKFSIPNLGCSTFNAQTKEGDHIFGRNFDLDYSPALLVKTKPDNGYASMSTVNLAFLGYNEKKLPDDFMKSLITLAAPYAPLDGVNEKGVSIGVLLIPTTPTNQQSDKIDITTTTAVRLVLDKAATVDEAIALLEKYDMHSSAGSSYHFQIADDKGKSVVVEFVDNKISIIKADKAYQAATNFLLTPGDYDFGKGQDCYETMMSTLHEKRGILSEKEGMDVLASVSQKMHDNGKGKESGTQWSIIYNNSKKTAEVVMSMQYDKKAHTFSLDD